MTNFKKITIFLLFISFVFFGNLNAGKDQDAGDIAQTMVDRMVGDVEFEDNSKIYTNILKEMESILFDSAKINSKYVTVKKVGNSYKLVDRNSHYLLDFGTDNKAARLVWLLFRTYGIERMCYVGRPKSSFNFVLSGGETQVNSAKLFYKVMVPGKAPAGDYPSITSSYKNLKIIKFKNSTLILKKYIAGETKYRIMSGNRVLYHFENIKEAIASFVFMKLYGFNQKCIIYSSEKPNRSGNIYGVGIVNKPLFTFLRKVIKKMSLRK